MERDCRKISRVKKAIKEKVLMRYAIISDIHSNLESLKAFLELIPEYLIEKIICLGDIVGYNTNPDECVKILSMLKNISFIRGNHDRAFIEKDYDYFSENARKAIIWTIKNTKPETKDFIKNIEPGPKLIDDLFMIAHGSLVDEDLYIFSKKDTKYDFKLLKEYGVNISFFGHTHWQTAFKLDKNDITEEIKSPEIKLKKNNFYLINPGSIGQPRDRDPRASFTVFDTAQNSIQIVRFNYNFAKTQEKIIKNRLPQLLADRLAVGF